LAYALDRIIADPDGASGPRARANAFARAALMLAKVPDAHEAASLSRDAARKLGVDPTQLWIEAQKLQGALRKPIVSAKPRGAEPSRGRVEDRMLVRLVLTDAEARTELLPLIEPDDIQAESLRTIMDALRRAPEAPAESLLTALKRCGTQRIDRVAPRRGQALRDRSAGRNPRLSEVPGPAASVAEAATDHTAIQEGASSKEGAAGTPFEEFVALMARARSCTGSRAASRSRWNTGREASRSRDE